LVDEFTQLVAGKWDEKPLAKAIRKSQTRRQLIRASMRQGAPARWNHGESAGETVRWYRGEGTYNDWAFDYSAPAES